MRSLSGHLASGLIVLSLALGTAAEPPRTIDDPTWQAEFAALSDELAALNADPQRWSDEARSRELERIAERKMALEREAGKHADARTTRRMLAFLREQRLWRQANRQHARGEREAALATLAAWRDELALTRNAPPTALLEAATLEATLLEALGRFPEAVGPAVEATGEARRLYPAGHWRRREVEAHAARLQRYAALPDADQQRIAEWMSRRLAPSANGDPARNDRRYLAAHQRWEELQALLGEEDLTVARAAWELAVLADAVGEHDAALGLMREVAQAHEQALGRAHPQVAYLLASAAEHAAHRDEPLLTHGLFVEAVARLMENHSAPNPPASDPLARATSSLALARIAARWLVLLDFSGSDPMQISAAVSGRVAAKEAVAAVERRWGMQSRQMLELMLAGVIFLQRLDKPTAARALLEEAARLGRHAGPDAADPHALAMRKLGDLHQAEGDTEAARRWLERASERLEEAHLPPSERIDVWASLAKSYQFEGRLDRAAQLYARVLEHLPATIPTGIAGQRAQQYRQSCCDVLTMLGRHAEALPIARQLIERRSRLLGRGGADVVLFRRSEELRDSVGRLLQNSAALDAAPDEAYGAVLAWKGRVFTLQAHIARAAGTEQDAADLRQELAAATRMWARDLGSFLAAPETVTILQHALIDRVEVAVPPPPQREEIVATLAACDGRAVLIDLVEWDRIRAPDAGGPPAPGYFRRMLSAFVVTGAGVRRVELGPAHDVTEQVEAWRQAVARGDRLGREAAGTWLREHVWLPLQPHVGDAEQVLVSPDGALARLPWGALPGARPGRFLIEQRMFILVPTAAALPAALAPRQVTGPPSLLVLGDVDYGSPPPDRGNAARVFAALPGTATELNAVTARFRRHWPEVAPHALRGAQATVARLRDQADQVRLMHLATHGYFSTAERRHASRRFRQAGEPSLPGDHVGVRALEQSVHPALLTGFVLAGANAPASEATGGGILTALEVATLDLANLDLAVLSACETGLGESAAGEGLLGLQRAFQVAGARTVVASLWLVPDAATARLMTFFYENLWDHRMTKAQALRQAQLTVMREQRPNALASRGADRPGLEPAPRSDHVIDWAAWTLSGDPGTPSYLTTPEPRSAGVQDVQERTPAASP